MPYTYIRTYRITNEGTQLRTRSVESFTVVFVFFRFFKARQTYSGRIDERIYLYVILLPSSSSHIVEKKGF